MLALGELANWESEGLEGVKGAQGQGKGICRGKGKKGGM